MNYLCTFATELKLSINMDKIENYESASQAINESEKFDSVYNQCDYDDDFNDDEFSVFG